MLYFQPVKRVVESDRTREHVSTYPHQVPRFVERTITKDVPVPNFVLQDKIVILNKIYKEYNVPVTLYAECKKHLESNIKNDYVAWDPSYGTA